MSLLLQTETEKLKKKILCVCSMVEENVEKAVISVNKKDGVLAKSVIRSDKEIDQIEVDVEEECLKILALHQPVAIDLRYVIAILKINNDLERIGDLAVNIAKQGVVLSQSNQIEIPVDFATMMEKVQIMLRNSLDAMVNMKETLAHEVLASDDEVDQIHLEMYKTIEATIQKEPKHTDLYIRIMSVSRNLERIADYATNIAEDVIYMIRGKIIRHGAGSQ